MAKLYAHGNDLSCVASGLGGKVLATAAKANSASQASIVLWDVSKRRKMKELHASELTITDLKFSMCGRGMAGASRDRSFCIFVNDDPVSHPFDFKLAIVKANAHTRLLNCVEWVHDAEMLATGSRDKTVKLHRGLNGETTVSSATISFIPSPPQSLPFLAHTLTSCPYEERTFLL